MSMNERILEKLRSSFPESIESENMFRNDLTAQIRKSDILRVCRFLCDDAELAFDMIIDLVGTDMYRPSARFEIVYNLYSLKNKCYARLKVAVDENEAAVDSVTSVWEGADWHEREAYDMIGVKFTGHPDHRRMYMPEEFEYHPLRKDFPLMGVPDSIPLPRK